MEITVFTGVAIVITLIFAIQRKMEYSIFASVFFSGFTGTSVLNVGGFSLQPSFYFGIVYLIYRCFTARRFTIRLPLSALVFLIYCICSAFFPIFFGQSGELVMNQEGLYVPIRLTSSNFTQILYLLFDFVFLNALLAFQNDAHRKAQFVRVFKAGLLCVELICCYQIIAFSLDLPFDILFRQSVHGNVQGMRLYGPCVEASMLCYFLVPAIAIVFQNRRNAFDFFLITLATVLGVLTRSSTFLLGGTALGLCAIPSVINFFLREHSMQVWKNVTLVLVGVVCVASVMFREMMETVSSFIEKLELGNDSGQERFESFLHMAWLGIQYPLGVGYGTSRSKDLLSTWLCNIGMVGLTLFILYCVSVVHRAARHKRISAALPFLLTIVLMFISVPEPYNLFVWYFIFYAVTTRKPAEVSLIGERKEQNPITSVEEKVHNAYV